MGASKTDQFSELQNNLANIARAMGHPARVAIIEYLLKADSCVCGDIVDELPLAQPTVSQHLKELKSCNVIKGETEGNSVCYCINESTWNFFKEWMEAGSEKMAEKKCC